MNERILVMDGFPTPAVGTGFIECFEEITMAVFDPSDEAIRYDCFVCYFPEG